MPVIKWNPWNISSIWEDDLELPTVPALSRLMGQGLNLYETNDSVVSELALPGIPEDKIDVSVEDRTVRVTASVQEKQEEKGQRRYFMTSMASSYNYSFKLPETVAEGEEPQAELENGILTLTFKKVQKAPPKKVKVIAKAKAK
ncbi:MAG: Hsp20/alpha crystallin family protein [Patescibacteria group bacterium]|nr:Hsp20/alpha crystallin family protein [Patescibacteria group bacterium]